jgi:hypothetical protein
MNLEAALDEIVEPARAELHIVRERAREKTPARDHGNQPTTDPAPPRTWSVGPIHHRRTR